jgi:hypothetical protein
VVSLDEHARANAIDEDEALAYHEAMRRAFARAGLSAGTLEQGLRIGDVGVKLRFAGQGLARVLLPALSPVLCANDTRRDVEVELWDETSTGVGAPQPLWHLRDVVARGDVRSLRAGRIRAHVDSSSRMLTVWDRERRHAIVWASAPHRLAYWVPAAPLRTVLHWSVASRQRHLLHAAAVGDEDAGALLVGPAGSGKSTTALACLAGGLGYIGDDLVVTESEPSPRALSVYGTAKLNPPSVRLLPELPAVRPHPEAEKFFVDVARARPDLMRRFARLSVILLPRVTPGRLAIRPATRAEAMHALAPSTILQHPDESATGMAVMTALLRRVPAYHLELGSDVAAVAPAIRGLLEASS